jgi:hypothetical protein
MKTLEANNIRTGSTDGEMAGMDILSKIQCWSMIRTEMRSAKFKR